MIIGSKTTGERGSYSASNTSGKEQIHELKVPVLIRPQTMTFMGTILGLESHSARFPFDIFVAMVLFKVS